MRLWRVVFYLSILLSLDSCFSVLLGVTATTAAVNAFQDKPFGAVVSDSVIWTDINTRFIVHDIFKPISVKVNEGKVLLTGNVQDVKMRVEAVKIVWHVYGVKEIHNEIQVNDHGDNVVKSSFITAEVKMRFLVNPNVRSMNYSVDTINGVVYLMGVAQGKYELQEVVRVASTIPGVKKVVSYIAIREELHRNKG